MRLVVIHAVLVHIYGMARFKRIEVSFDDVVFQVLPGALRVESRDLHAELARSDGRLVLAAGIERQAGLCRHCGQIFLERVSLRLIEVQPA